MDQTRGETVSSRRAPVAAGRSSLGRWAARTWLRVDRVEQLSALRYGALPITC